MSLSDGAHELLLEVSHVKYRNSEAGKSPIGNLLIFREHVEWRDRGSDTVNKFQFVTIKGQRVSPPNKSKVQLQLCMHNDDQATFVFMNPSYDKEALAKERDLIKETLQQALIAHRARVAQLAAQNESCSRVAELEAKQKLLFENKRLEQLYKHLVSTKIISSADFWTDYYKTDGNSLEKVGVSGGFLGNIAQAEGANGVKLNLNTEIIQAIFNTYPVVEKKHLELVPHEMTEEAFWTKFFHSHYFHREREVLPNPNDPFADCVKMDEAEIQKLVQDGVNRKRFDFEYLSDSIVADMNKRPEPPKTANKTILVRRCNYLSERILASLKANVETNGTNIKRSGGFAALQRVVEDVDSRLDSTELANEGTSEDIHPVKLKGEQHDAAMRYPAEEADHYKTTLANFLKNNSDDKILADDSWLDCMDTEDPIDMSMDDQNNTDLSLSDWNLPPLELNEVRTIHESVSELLKHFWCCFPPNTPELEKKLERMHETLAKYAGEQLSHASHKYGAEKFKHCFDMIERATERYKQYYQRKK